MIWNSDKISYFEMRDLSRVNHVPDMLLSAAPPLGERPRREWPLGFRLCLEIAQEHFSPFRRPRTWLIAAFQPDWYT